MTTPKPGDRVKVTYIATYDREMNLDGVFHRLRGDNLILDAPASAELTVLVPEQPPVGSIVTDSDGDAWQRRLDGWVMVGSRDFHDWEYLVENFGLVKIMRVGN